MNVRILAATNKDLKSEIEDKTFREDLYHRLSVIVIKVPPLNERKGDIPLLVDKFLDDIANEYGEVKKTITEGALEKMKETDWSGNIRELRNVVERLIIMCNQEITAQDIERYL